MFPNIQHRNNELDDGGDAQQAEDDEQRQKRRAGFALRGDGHGEEED